MDDGTIVTPLHVAGIHVTVDSGEMYPICATVMNGATSARTNPYLSMSSSGVLTAAKGLSVTSGDLVVSSGSIKTTSGSISSGGNLSASGSISTVSGNISTSAGSISAGGSITASSTITAGGDISTTAGSIYTSSGDIRTTSGSITAGKSITAGTTITAGGEIKGASFDTSSDARLKENLEPLEKADGLLDMPLYEFDYKNSGRHSMGCLAQDLQKIAPELVSEGEDGYLQVKESKLVYYLMLEVKELRDRLAKLEKGE